MLEEYISPVKLWIGDHHKTIGLSVGGLILSWKLGGFLIEKIEEHKKQEILRQWENGPKDKVILHTLPRGKTIPNLSPFAMKLETYLRINKIPYEVDFELPMGPLGKTPWITLNGDHIVDSQLIIDFLRDKFDVTLGQNYTDEQRAIALPVRIMMDEYFYWGLALWRYVYSEGKGLDQIFDMPAFALKVFHKMASQRVTENAWCQGIGRHDKEKVFGMMKDVLKSVELILGGKNKYLLGEFPCEEDCSLFGFTGMILWAAPGSPYEKFLGEECPNLREYCERMKQEYWGDWDNILTKKMIKNFVKN